MQLPTLLLLACVAVCSADVSVRVVAASGATVQLDAFGPHSIRIRAAPPGQPIVNPPIQALLPAPESADAHAHSPVSADPAANTLTNGNLAVSVDPASGLITATRIDDGAVLLKQTILSFGPPAVGSAQGSVSSLVSFAGHAGERVYGLGEHRTGVVNQMPYYKNFSDSQLYSDSRGGDVSIPWYASSLGYGFLWNLPSYGYVNISFEQITWHSVASLNADFWITTTSAANSSNIYAELLSHYVDAVGHASEMPYYATGFIQCKNRYRNQTQLLEVAHGYVDRGLPISVIVIDYFHWVNQGDWAFNSACWPDPQGMVDELESLGIKTMVTFWPFQTTPSQHWEEFSSNNYLVKHLDGSLQPFDGNQYLYDPFNPAAQNATWNGFFDGYGKYGIKTIWLDAAEPERFDQGNVGNWRFAAGTDSEVGEAWVQQHVQTISKGMASIGVQPNEFFTLPRHNWVGTWRHSAGLWSGDIQSTFEELALQVRVAQGVAMSGTVLWTTDIGGYANGDPNDPTFQELIVRWFQFGAFCPLFRLHGSRNGGPPANECGDTNGDNEVWNLAKDAAHYEGITRVMFLRENLRDYVATINQEAAQTGMPMLRPMVLQWPLDAGCQGGDVEDQFMFGPMWLVAPVLTYQATSRSVYLPLLDASKEEWVYFFNETSVGAGGNRVTVPTPIQEFPLFYRRPVPTLGYGNLTALWSAERTDVVTCLSSQCYAANQPGNPGNYTIMEGEGRGLLTTDLPVEIEGKVYDTVPLNLFYSQQHQDNFIATNTTGPDSSYTYTTFNNGYVLREQAPGSVPLQVWYSKDFDDYASVSSPAGLAWVHKYNYVYMFTTGYVFA